MTMHASLWTILFQVINFLILVWVLQRFLYKPVLAVIDRRRQENERALADAAAARAAAEEVRRQLEAERDGMAAERGRAQAALKAELDVERQKLMDATRAECAALLETGRTQLQRERAEAAVAIRDQAARLSVELAERLLGAAAPATIAPTMVDRLLAELRGMSPAERERLLPDDSSRVRVVSAVPIPPSDMEALRARLGESVGRVLELDWSIDPALLAGLELHFPHAILRCTWRDALRGAGDAMAVKVASA